jgi:alpha-amylase
MATFKPASWTHTTNIYEVNLRQYTAEGTFNAFAKELPRLAEMGVETLWFMPIHPISESGRKGTLGSYYAVQDYTATNSEFGSVQDFKDLVKQAHHLGLKVIIDWVANHSGNDNVWIVQHPGFFERDNNGAVLHPYDWEDVSKINYGSKDLRKTMIAAMQFWITNCDIDGFRCDMAHLVPLSFWEQARTVLDQVKSELFWLAETEDIAYHFVFDASYTWEWMHKTEDYCKHATDMGGLWYVLNKYKDNFPSAAYRVYYTSNHDENSHTGTEYDKFGDAAHALAVFSCTWDGIPMLYSGQELPNLKKLAFFDKDVIEWNSKYQLQDFYKTLLSLHKNNPALKTADPAAITINIQTDKASQVMSYLRKNGDKEVLVILNLSPDYFWAEVTDINLAGKFTNVFSNIEYDFSSNKFFELLPWGYLVYEKK